MGMGQIPAGSADMPPVEVEPSTPKRTSARSDSSEMADNSAKQPLNEPNSAPHFYADTSYKALHMSRRQHGYRNRDARLLLIARLLAMDQPARKRAREDPGVQCSEARNRSLPAVLRAGSVVNKEVARQRGQWWESSMKDG